jgi:hypothetical protein
MSKRGRKQSEKRSAKTGARVWGATALVAAASLLPSAALLTQLDAVLRLSAAPPDQVTEFERRLAPLKAAVRGQAAVGYHWPAADVPLTPTESAHLYLSQYSLAPVLLANDRRLPLVVADAAFRPERGPFLVPPGFEIVRDFGNGVFLLKPVP